VTARGKVHGMGTDLLLEIFKAKPYMADIYPDEKSRSALTVFQVHRREGEFFDLAAKPIFREHFFLRRRRRSGKRLLCNGQVYWLQAVLFRLPSEVY